MGALSLVILGIRANRGNEVRVLEAWAVGIWKKGDRRLRGLSPGRVTVFITGRPPPGDQPKNGKPIASE